MSTPPQRPRVPLSPPPRTIPRPPPPRTPSPAPAQSPQTGAPGPLRLEVTLVGCCGGMKSVVACPIKHAFVGVDIQITQGTKGMQQKTVDQYTTCKACPFGRFKGLSAEYNGATVSRVVLCG